MKEYDGQVVDDCIDDVFNDVMNAKINYNRKIYAREKAKEWYYNNKDRSKISNREWKRNNKKRRDYLNKKSYLKQTYGITLEQYLNIKLKQDNKCAICKKEDKLNIDHCHKTGRIRELLCGKCNKMLGLAGDNIDILLSAVGYLNKWNN